jgi:hypothetical protein
MARKPLVSQRQSRTAFVEHLAQSMARRASVALARLMRRCWQRTNPFAARVAGNPRTHLAMRLDLQPANSAARHAAAGVAVAMRGTASRAMADDAWPLGAHLVSERAGYSHHGIYVGNGRVVHYAGLCESLHRGPIEEVTLERFADGHAIRVEPHPHARYAGRDAVLRARSRLGEARYRLLTNNCEHFCTWCVDGKGRSAQVRTCVMHPRAAWRFLMSMCGALIDARRDDGCRVATAMRTA